MVTPCVMAERPGHQSSSRGAGALPTIKVVLEAQRRRLAEFERQEAAGANLWSESFPEVVRVRLETAFEAGFAEYSETLRSIQARSIDTLLRQSGIRPFRGTFDVSDVTIRHAVLSGESEPLPSVIEAAMQVFASDEFDRAVKEILEQERIAYRVVNRQLVPFESLELHETVVAPTLRLLAGRPELADVEEGYQGALKEIGSNPADAITDAGRALQAMLTVIGCVGNSIGAQLKDARRKNLLAPHDATLSAGIEKIIDWVSADRSERGDTHKAVNVTPEDAWFAVHVVGALILRLAEGRRV
jgi:hypothetical protein